MSDYKCGLKDATGRINEALLSMHRYYIMNTGNTELPAKIMNNHTDKVHQLLNLKLQDLIKL